MVVNLLLVAASVALGWKLALDWRSARDRQINSGLSANDNRPSYVPPASKAVAMAGGEVVSSNPFSPDRSSVIEQAAPVAAGPPPQLPVVVGTMRLGANYEALMAESAQTASTSFKQVKTGAVVGGYTVAEIRDDEVVVELNGERTTINVYLSSSGVARSTARTLVPTVPSAPKVETSSTLSSSSPGQSVAASSAASSAQLPSPDPTLKITIEGNRRRYERTTMFGPQIWYEDIR